MAGHLEGDALALAGGLVDDDDRLAGVALGLGVQVGVLELEAHGHGVTRGVDDVTGLELGAVGDHDLELGERQADVGQGAAVARGHLGAVVGADTDGATDEALEAVLEVDRVGTPVALRADAPGGGAQTLVPLLDDHGDLAGPRRLAGDVLLLGGAEELGVVGGAGDHAGLVLVEEDLLGGAVDGHLCDAVALGLVVPQDGAGDDGAGQRGAGLRDGRGLAGGDRRRGDARPGGRALGLRLSSGVRRGQEDSEVLEAELARRGHERLLRVMS